jgi:hypothetical protein
MWQQCDNDNILYLSKLKAACDSTQINTQFAHRMSSSHARKVYQFVQAGDLLFFWFLVFVVSLQLHSVFNERAHERDINLQRRLTDSTHEACLSQILPCRGHVQHLPL